MGVRVDPEIRQLALSSLLLGFVGPTPPRWLLDALADGLGGIVLFGSNLTDGRDVDRLTARLRAVAGRDIVLALDEEGGDVTRLDAVRGSPSPGAAALGFLDDVAATEQAYTSIGARLVEAGVTVDLAPVADVNVDPRNPVIGVRSFGADPHVVARHVAAAVRGLQSQGIAACVKHFPGHGATTSDSHHEVATLHRSADELDAVELPPFAAAIMAGTRAVMTGHLRVPALDPAQLATVSPAINGDLLRGLLGFRGTVVTDALEMRALADTLGMPAGFVAAVAAGADAIETGALEYPQLVTAIPEAVQNAVDSGGLTLARLRDAATRTAALAVVRPPAPGDAATDRQLAEIAARCLEMIGALPHLERPLVIEARPPDGMASGALPWSLVPSLGSRIAGVDGVSVHDAQAAAAAIRDAGGRQVVAVLRDPARHPWQLPLAKAAAVIVDVGWPVELGVEVAVVRTRGVAPGLLDGAARILATA
jgi:beta-N-acetylhexosaminidase